MTLLNNIWEEAMVDDVDLGPETLVFQNDLIVKTIQSYLSFNDLKHARLVNRLWARASFPHMCKRAIAQFWRAAFIFYKGKDSWPREKLAITDFMSNYSNWPIRKFFVDDCFFAAFISAKDLPRKEMLIEEMFPLISQTVVQLNLHHRTQEPWIWPKCTFPHLRQLTLDLHDDADEEKTKSSFQEFAHIIQNAPNLDSLTFFYLKLGHRSDSVFAATPFFNAMNNPNGRKIRHLQFRGLLNDAHLQQLQDLGLQLQTLTLQFTSRCNFSADVFENFLQQQSATLRELDIESFALTKTLNIKFPRMSHVCSLRLSVHRQCRTSVGCLLRFPFLSYPTQFPALKKLSLFQDQVGNLDDCLCYGMKPVKSVEILELPEFEHVTRRVVEAVRLFPNVKNLSVDARSVEENVQLQQMSKVEYLTLRGSTAELSLFHLTQVREENVPEKEVNPHCFLEKLKVLKITEAKITDVGANMILRKAKNLQCLDLWECRNSQVGEEILQKMRDQFSVYRSMPHTFPEVSID